MAPSSDNEMALSQPIYSQHTWCVQSDPENELPSFESGWKAGGAASYPALAGTEYYCQD